MIVNNTSNIKFEARIRINKPKLQAKAMKYAGSSMISGGVSSLSTCAASGADMIVHSSNGVVPVMQYSSSLFDQFAQAGHKIFNLIEKNYKHNGYDAAFFSTASSSDGIGAYSYGMNTLIKGIEKEYANKKIPTL